MDDRAGAAGAWREALALDPSNPINLIGVAIATDDAGERLASLRAARAEDQRDAKSALLLAATLAPGDDERRRLLDGLARSAPEASCLAESLLWLEETMGFNVSTAATASA